MCFSVNILDRRWVFALGSLCFYSGSRLLRRGSPDMGLSPAGTGGTAASDFEERLRAVVALENANLELARQLEVLEREQEEDHPPWRTGASDPRGSSRENIRRNLFGDAGSAGPS